MRIDITIRSRKDKEILRKLEELRLLIITSVQEPERIKALAESLSEDNDKLQEAINKNSSI